GDISRAAQEENFHKIVPVTLELRTASACEWIIELFINLAKPQEGVSLPAEGPRGKGTALPSREPISRAGPKSRRFLLSKIELLKAPGRRKAKLQPAARSVWSAQFPCAFSSFNL